MDDAAEGYYKEKLRMSRREFLEIVEALSSAAQGDILQGAFDARSHRRIRTLSLGKRGGVREQHVVIRYRSHVRIDCSGGRDEGASQCVPRDDHLAFWVAAAGRSARVRGEGFPNYYGCIDYTDIYVDKPANAPSENYFDGKHHFSVVAQVVVDLDLRVTDVFVGYPRSCHDIRVLQLSSLWTRAEEGNLFRGPAVLLPFGNFEVQTHGYILGDNGYPPMEWIMVPFGQTDQIFDEERLNNKQKVAKGAVERAFGRLKGMWRLFLRTHKTNMDTLPQTFQVVCILHNIFLDTGIDFDDNLLWEVDANGVRRRVDLGMDHPPHPIAENFSRPQALALREALAERMKHE
ncbi:hypothetical protein CBR_g51763 [Chara braunii]|uniref:DDE Tnp4 domain-containing protein n=1 Tax=Chara braunii TaxID=69332 RepID=A0A388M901_CHABU|nr:hypothetical protein CBR_g51763 [Chara braunii]|eukprot:GBG91030.1 hypothetical protein CBR_g51763 [Chara braunii]